MRLSVGEDQATERRVGNDEDDTVIGHAVLIRVLDKHVQGTMVMVFGDYFLFCFPGTER